jgi:hypothetical protein
VKKTLILLSICLLSVVCVSGQTQTDNRPVAPSKTEIQAANKAWPAFWRAFLAAVKRRDHSALKKMMPDDFFDGGGGLTPTEWLDYIEENKTPSSRR